MPSVVVCERKRKKNHIEGRKNRREGTARV
jgi:hypothetical protein